MTMLQRLRRALGWTGGLVLVAALPACAPPKVQPAPVAVSHPSQPAFPAAGAAVTTIPAVTLAAGQSKADDEKKSSVSRSTPSPNSAAPDKPLPINLPTALALAGASPLDIQIAAERLEAAAAALDRANVLWLPNLNVGVDYFRHDGQIQDVAGTVFTTSRSSLLLGGGPNAVFAVTDAIYAPLAAQQVVQARQAEAQAVRNDTTLRVAEAYFTVQQARGEVAGSMDALRRAEELVKLTEKVAPELAPTVEVNRARTEAARRRLALESAYERWHVAGADLTRLLRLAPGTLVEPAEEPALKVELIDPAATLDQLIPIALAHRPELAADQAQIQAAQARVEQERARPFIPTLAVRGVGSQVPGLAGGLFGGGMNSYMGNFGGRMTIDVQAVWELQNLGWGNQALVREREAENRQALLQLLQSQDRVAAEVVQAHARVKRSAARLNAAASAVADAGETADKSLRGLVPGKRVGEQLVLIVRPQEAVAAVAALDQAYRDYYTAVADHNRAQYQLYRALGHPAQFLAQAAAPATMLPCTTIATPAPAPGAPPGTGKN